MIGGCKVKLRVWQALFRGPDGQDLPIENLTHTIIGWQPLMTTEIQSPLKSDIFALIGVTMQTISSRHWAFVFDDIPCSVESCKKLIVRRIDTLYS
jgi:hypothetical protein